MRILGFVVTVAAAALSLSQMLTAQAPPHVFDTATGQRIKVTEVAGGLVHPYSLAFPDARTMLVAESAGRLRVIRDGVLLPKPAWEAPPPAPGSKAPANGGERLHFIALHPAFERKRLVYLTYSHRWTHVR